MFLQEAKGVAAEEGEPGAAAVVEPADRRACSGLVR